MAIPKLIHQTGPDVMPPAYRPEWQQSWKDAHPSYTYAFHSDADLLATATTKLSTHASLFADANVAGVIKGDFGRLMMLYLYGGVYADLDYVCLKPVDPLLTKAPLILSEMQTMPASFGRLPPQWQFIHNAFIAAEPKHPFILAILTQGLADWRTGRIKSPEMLAGPQQFIRARKLYKGVDYYIAPPDDLCPLSYMNGANPPDMRDRVNLAGDSVAQLRAYWPNAYAATFWVHQW